MLLLIISLMTILLTVDVFAAKKKQQDRTPQLTVMLPRADQTVVGDSMTLQVFSTTTRIKESGGKNRQNEGYVKATFDTGAPIKVFTTTQRLKMGYLKEGKHALTVELVQNDGSSFSQPVKRTIEFTVARSAVLRKDFAKQERRMIHPARMFSNKRI